MFGVQLIYIHVVFGVCLAAVAILSNRLKEDSCEILPMKWTLYSGCVFFGLLHRTSMHCATSIAFASILILTWSGALLFVANNDHLLFYCMLSSVLVGCGYLAMRIHSDEDYPQLWHDLGVCRYSAAELVVFAFSLCVLSVASLLPARRLRIIAVILLIGVISVLVMVAVNASDAVFTTIVVFFIVLVAFVWTLAIHEV
jgi:hypothetical protein